MIVKLLTEHHLEFLSLKGGCTGSFESTLVKMSNCWKSHAAAQFCVLLKEQVTRKKINLRQFLFVNNVKVGTRNASLYSIC